jgi:signal transduction histidine kinase
VPEIAPRAQPIGPPEILVNAVALANATTFGLASALGAFVMAKRSSRSVDVPLLALICGLLVWSGGAVWRALPYDHEQLMAAHHLVFLGVNAVPPAWLLLALAATRVEFFQARPTRALWLCLPGLLFYVAFVTNPAHHQFAHIHFQTFERGPLFWGMIAWAFTCSVAGTVVFLARARWLATRRKRPAAILLAAVGLVPQVAAATYLFHILPWPMDPTPASLGISAAFLYPVIRRTRTFEHLPLMRRDVIEQLPDAVLITDPDGRIVDLNPAAEALLRDGETLRDAPLEDVLSDASPTHGPALLRLLRETGGASAPDLEFGDGRRFRLQAAAVAGGDRAPVGYFLVLHDRSDELRAERALRQAQKLDSVGMLAAGIAHELNNPLAYVRANLLHLAKAAEVAARLAPADEADAALIAELPGVLSETCDGVDRIAGIVSGMQRLSRHAGAAREPLDLRGVVDESIRLAAFSQTPCRVEQHLDAGLPPVRGSRPELVQVLLNLLLNAKQAVAARPDGMVRVRTRSAPGEARVDVEDNGPGIPDALTERIFDPFFTTKDPDQGTGLGLSIAYDLVRDHGGRLEVAQSPLGGARFTLRLPAAPGPVSGRDAPARPDA